MAGSPAPQLSVALGRFLALLLHLLPLHRAPAGCQWLQPEQSGLSREWGDSGVFGCFIFPSAPSQHSVLSPRPGAQQPGQRAKQPPSCPLLFSSVLLFVMDGLFSWMPSHARGRHWTSIEEMRSGDQLCFLSCEERELALVPHKPAICSDLHCLATNATSRWSPGRHQPGACSLC